jgi:hypothetical protein
MQPGDMVAVLLRSTVTSILRPRRTSAHPYTYLGEGHYYGFMHGEALQDPLAQDIRTFDIG